MHSNCNSRFLRMFAVFALACIAGTTSVPLAAKYVAVSDAAPHEQASNVVDRSKKGDRLKVLAPNNAVQRAGSKPIDIPVRRKSPPTVLADFVSANFLVRS